DAGLRDVPEVSLPRAGKDVQHAWHLYAIQIDVEKLRIDRNDFIKKLNSAGVGTSVHYTPLHMHPYYRDTWGYRPDDLPVAQSAYERIISLPLYPKLSRADVDFVVDAVRRIVLENRR
ncbi:MAG TPA: DegT/DnrJ/EryC1/StrS family aminotransferase, partial [Planctomycetaceae bacterium]|nr:DegT/DnrJ/EryC1/StrS family aminotransferase [Planctomycetaceae bacterium]